MYDLVLHGIIPCGLDQTKSLHHASWEASDGSEPGRTNRSNTGQKLTLLKMLSLYFISCSVKYTFHILRFPTAFLGGWGGHKHFLFIFFTSR